MRKIKVLQMFVANTKGGRTQFMLNTWKHINRNRFAFDFATLSKELDFEEKLRDEGCNVFHISCYAEEDYDRFTAQLKEILENGYDVVHINSSLWRSFAVERTSREMNVGKIIIHAHNNGIGIVAHAEEIKELERNHFVLRNELKEDMADFFLACSKEAADWLYGNRISSSRIRIINYGIELNRFSYSELNRKRIRYELGIDDKYVIGNIGRFVYQKNHEFLVDVFFDVQKEIDNAVLLLIGIGALENEIKAKVYSLGIEDKVIFLGKRNDISDLLQAMDIFAFPSRFEGFGISLLEAQAASLPCIASNVPKEASLDSNNLILKLEKRQWVDAIIERSRNIERIQIDKDILSKHDILKQVEELEKIYEI